MHSARRASSHLSAVKETKSKQLVNSFTVKPHSVKQSEETRAINRNVRMPEFQQLVLEKLRYSLFILFEDTVEHNSFIPVNSFTVARHQSCTQKQKRPVNENMLIFSDGFLNIILK